MDARPGTPSHAPDSFALVVARMASLAARAAAIFAIVAGVLLGILWGAHRLGVALPAPVGKLFLEQEQAAEALLYVYDNETGWKMNPYTQLHYVRRGPFERGEAQDVRLRTNSEGFFDREHDAATAYYRIAFLGDSWLEAQQVDPSQRFTQLIEDYVHSFSGGKRAVEVMNFGVSNLGTAQELGVARKYVAKYRPDEIWLVFNPADDVSDSSGLLTDPPLGPTFTYDQAGEVADVRFGYADPPAVTASLRRARYGDWMQLGKARVLPYFFAAESHPAFEAAFKEMRACFRMLAKAVPGARVTVLYVPPERELSARDWEAYVNEARRATGRELTMDPMNAEKRIAAMAQAEGASFVSLRPLIREKGNAEMYQGHLSRMGHHWVADLIARRLLASDCCAMPRGARH